MPATSLLSKIDTYLADDRAELVRNALEFATDAHLGQSRLSGEPYVEHPIATAEFLAERRMDATTLAAALLHDVIEDCEVSREQIEHRFGDEVAKLVDGVTKMNSVDVLSPGERVNAAFALNDNEDNDDERTARQAASMRKMLVAMAEDVRVVLIKLADRLHNMRTITFVKNKNKQIRKAKETMEIYSPLADRMGMNRIRDELEDLSFQVLNNDARELIKRRLDEIKEDRTNSFKSISFEFIDLLNQNNINAQIFGREKTPFSIWRKVQKKRVSLERITDIIGFRVILNNVEDCYKALGIFH